MPAAQTLQTQVEEKLRQRILAGEWAPGTAISSENELCREYGISRVTARSVLTQLVGAGLLYRIPGKGTFVREQATVKRSGPYQCVRERLRDQGQEVDTKLISQQVVPASVEAAEALKLSCGAPVVQVHKVCYLGGRPMSVNWIWYPAERFPGLEDRDITHGNSCALLLEEYGAVREHVHETLESLVASFDEAQYLGVLPGHPLLLLRSTFIAQDEKPYEYSRVVFRGDLIRLSFDY